MPRTKGYLTNGNRDLIVLNKDRLHTRRHHRSRNQKTQRRVTRGRVTRGRVTRGRNQKTQRRVTRGRVTRGRNQRGRNQRGRNQRGRNQKTQRRIQRGGIVMPTGTAIGLAALGVLGVSGLGALITHYRNKYKRPSEPGSDAAVSDAVSGSDTASSDTARESETLQPGVTGPTREERMKIHDRINSLFDILVLAYKEKRKGLDEEAIKTKGLDDKAIDVNAGEHIAKIMKYYNEGYALDDAINKELEDKSNPLTSDRIKNIETELATIEGIRAKRARTTIKTIKGQAAKASTEQKTEAAHAATAQAATAPAATAPADEKGAATAPADEKDNGSSSKRKLQLSF